MEVNSKIEASRRETANKMLGLQRKYDDSLQRNEKLNLTIKNQDDQIRKLGMTQN